MSSSRIEAVFESMDAPKLREILKTLCKRQKVTVEDATGKIEIDGSNTKISEGFVDLTQSGDSDIEDEDGDTEESEKSVSSGDEEENVAPLSKADIKKLVSSKRSKTYIFKCENCKEEFDIGEQGGKDCWYHPGDKEEDDEGDFWADHDDDCHGPAWAHVNDPNFADGFIWSCCEELGSAKGCKNTRHKAAIEGKKRARH